MVKKRLAALALSIVLVVGLMPAVALASAGDALIVGKASLDTPATLTTQSLYWDNVEVVGGPTFYGTPQTVKIRGRLPSASTGSSVLPNNHTRFELVGPGVNDSEEFAYFGDWWLDGGVCEWKYTVNEPGTYYVRYYSTDYSGAEKYTTNFTVEKARKANPITVKAKTVTFKASKVKKKAQSVKASKAFTVKKAQGKVSYKKVSGNKKISVSKAGKVTIKKGAKKGTYKAKVKVTAAGSAAYKSGSKTVTLAVRVK